MCLLLIWLRADREAECRCSCGGAGAKSAASVLIGAGELCTATHANSCDRVFARNKKNKSIKISPGFWQVARFCDCRGVAALESVVSFEWTRVMIFHHCLPERFSRLVHAKTSRDQN